MAAVNGIGSQILQRAYEQATTSSTPAPDGGGFSSRLQELVSEVDRAQDEAGALQTRAMRGEEVAVHDVTIASQEAGLAFSLMLEIRNKLVDAYQELMRMQA